MKKNKTDLKVIIHLIGNTFGGVASIAITLIKDQIKNGDKVYAVFFSEQDNMDSLSNEGINVIYVPKKTGYGQNMFFGMGIRKIYKKIKRDHPDKLVIIHAHNVATVGLFPFIKNIPMVCTIHGACVRGRLSLRDKISEIVNIYIIRKLIHAKKYVIAVSEATAQYYQTRVNNGTIYVIHNGISTHKTSQFIEKKSGEIWIGHVGGVTKSKGWDTLAEAFGIACESLNKNLKLICAGKISYEKSKLEELIVKNSLNGEIELLGLIPDAGNAFIPSIDVLVLPSIGEGLPASILEAFAYGKPVIATNVGGITEAVQDGINGFIVAKDKNVIAKRLISLITNKELYIRMSDNARNCYLKRFDSRIMWNKYELIYKKIK